MLFVGVGSTPAPLSLPVCALAPSCFSPIVPKCVAEMDLALHEIKTELGVFPRWKQFQFVKYSFPFTAVSH